MAEHLLNVHAAQSIVPFPHGVVDISRGSIVSVLDGRRDGELTQAPKRTAALILLRGFVLGSWRQTLLVVVVVMLSRLSISE